MARVLLINYAGYPCSPNSLMPDNGLANLAGQLISTGNDVLILDYSTISTMKKLSPESYFEKMSDYHRKGLETISSEIIEHTASFNPNVVGFKLWWGDGFFGSIFLAEKVKEYDRKILTIGGGPHVDYFQELIFKKTKALDILAFGDGENIISDLARYTDGKKRLEDIANIIYYQNGKLKINKTEWVRDLNSLSFPVYDEEVYPSMKGDDKIKIIVLDESRGCSFKCHFCIQPIKSGRLLRIIKPEKAVEIIGHLQKRYGFNAFRFAGSSTPGRLMQRIGEEIIKSRLNVKYTSFARVNYANPDFFSLMKESGLKALFFGVESGSQKILDNSINKQVNIKEIERVLLASKQSGIYTIASVIVPSPLDTEQTIEETYEFLKKINSDSVIVNSAGVFPRTEWFLNPSKFGIEITSPCYLEELMLYKPLLLFPPDKWEPLSYKIDGKNFSEILKESAEFNSRIEALGIPTSIPDDMYMMSTLAGLAPSEFRDKCRDYISSGNYQSMQGLVIKINKGMTKNE